MPSRRVIILGGLGAAGSLVVGYAVWPSDRLARADKLAAKPGERFVNNWIKIATDGRITIVVPHCDMGTGIYTALPQMAAEELDADWSTVHVEAAPSDPLFANGPVAEQFVLSQRHMTRERIPAFLRGTIDNSFRAVAAFMDLQTTGGSSAVRGTGVYGMRLAGAAAREMLIKAAAVRWNVPSDECSTRSNRVLHASSARSFGYGELAAEAAMYSPPSNPKVKSRRDYTLVGTSVPRIDIPNKVNGTTHYGIDVVVPGMAYAAIKISPVFGGTLVSVDDSAVRHKRGIIKTVRLDDAVVVIADRFWRARDAADLLKPIFDDKGNGRVTTASMSEQRKIALYGDLKSDCKTGFGADAAQQPGRRSFEAIYQVPYLAHAPMEPVNATALYKNGTLEVWAGAQDGLGARAYCAKTANLPMEKVTFHLQPIGGAFGRSLPGQWNYLAHAVKTAMALPEIPIKLIYTREQDLQHDYYRPNVLSRMRAALDSKGVPFAWSHDYTTDNNASTLAYIPYDIPNQEYRTAQIKTHIPTGAWRSVEASWHGFFVESFIDELAHQAQADPVAYRLALLAKHPRHCEVVKTAARLANWGTPLPPRLGRGIAVFECFDSIVAHVAEVEVSSQGTLAVHRVVSAIDCGMAVHPDGVRAQIEGGVVFGLSAALFGAITIEQGAIAQSNFPEYDMVRLAQCPEIEVHIVESGAVPGGAGEPGVPPLAAALTNAVFAATGMRIRQLPLAGQSLLPAPEPLPLRRGVAVSEP